DREIILHWRADQVKKRRLARGIGPARHSTGHLARRSRPYLLNLQRERHPPVQISLLEDQVEVHRLVTDEQLARGVAANEAEALIRESAFQLLHVVFLDHDGVREEPGGKRKARRPKEEGATDRGRGSWFVHGLSLFVRSLVLPIHLRPTSSP